MTISVSYYGKNKPGVGVKPVRVEPNFKLPFGKPSQLNWWTGKHVALRKGGDGSAVYLDDLLDVDLSALNTQDDPHPEDGDILFFSKALGMWVSFALAAEDPDTDIDEIGAESEGSESASSDSWEAGGVNGLSEWYVSRVVYNHSGDKKVYAFLRKRVYDRYGRLFSVSGESRIEVDATVPES